MANNASNNIIVFNNPRANSANLNIDDLSKENINSNVEMMKMYHIQEVLSVLSPMIFNQLEVAGFIFDEDELGVKDGAFIIESIRSLLCKHYGIYHPFQRIVDVALLEDVENINMLKVAEMISVNLLEEKVN